LGKIACRLDLLLD